MTAALAGLFCLGLTVWAVRHPRLWLIFSFGAIIFSPAIAVSVPMFSLGDEAAIALTLVVALLTRKERKVQVWRQFPGMLAFAAFTLAGLVSAVTHEVPIGTSVAGALLAVKGVVYGWAVAQIRFAKTDYRTLQRGFAWLVGLIVAGVVANIIVGPAWFDWFSAGEGSMRGGILSPAGLLSHPGWLAQACALSFTAIVITTVLARRINMAQFICMSVLLATVVLTYRRKSLVALVLVIIVLALLIRAVRATLLLLIAGVTALLAVTIGPLLLTAFDSTFDSYVTGASTSPRSLLYSGGLELAERSFPLGEGFGRYGTAVAARDYSPLYYELGYNFVYGLAPGDAYALDTFWPGVLGETGWLGFICYFGGQVLILRYLTRALKVAPEPTFEKCILLIGIAWWVEYLVESVAAPVYLAAPLGPVFFGFVGLVVAVRASSAPAISRPFRAEPIETHA